MVSCYMLSHFNVWKTTHPATQEINLLWLNEWLIVSLLMRTSSHYMYINCNGFSEWCKIECHFIWTPLPFFHVIHSLTSSIEISSISISFFQLSPVIVDYDTSSWALLFLYAIMKKYNARDTARGKIQDNIK